MNLNKKLILMLSISLVTINIIGDSQKNFYTEKVKETVNNINNTKIGQSINEFISINVWDSVNELIDTGIVKNCRLY